MTKTSWGKEIEFAEVAEQHEAILAGLAGERAHSRFIDSTGRDIQWTYNEDGSMADLPAYGLTGYRVICCGEVMTLAHGGKVTARLFIAMCEAQRYLRSEDKSSISIEALDQWGNHSHFVEW